MHKVFFLLITQTFVFTFLPENNNFSFGLHSLMTYFHNFTWYAIKWSRVCWKKSKESTKMLYRMLERMLERMLISHCLKQLPSITTFIELTKAVKLLRSLSQSSCWRALQFRKTCSVTHIHLNYVKGIFQSFLAHCLGICWNITYICIHMTEA